MQKREIRVDGKVVFEGMAVWFQLAAMANQYKGQGKVEIYINGKKKDRYRG